MSRKPSIARASIQPLPSGRWRARYLPKGADQKTGWIGPIPKRSFATKAEAKDWASGEIARLVAGEAPPEKAKASMTVGEFWRTKFWNVPAHARLGDGTKEDYESTYRSQVAPRWDDVPLRQINREDVMLWKTVELPTQVQRHRSASQFVGWQPIYKRMRRDLGQFGPGRPKEGQEPASVTIARAKAKAAELNEGGATTGKPIGPATQRMAYLIFTMIVRSAALDFDGYLSKVPLPRKPGLGRPEIQKAERFLEPSEVGLLINAVERHQLSLRVPFCDEFGPDEAMSPFANQVLTAVLANLGPRIGEAFGLRVNDLDENKPYVRFDEQQTFRRGRVTYTDIMKGGRKSERSVPAPGYLMALLWELVEREIGWGDPTAHLFRGRSDAWYKQVFAAARNETGLAPLTPHDLRHTAASLWFAQGYELFEVAEFLGDTLETAKSVYIHIYKRREDPRMQRLNDEMVEAIDTVMGGRGSVALLRSAGQQ